MKLGFLITSTLPFSIQHVRAPCVFFSNVAVPEVVTGSFYSVILFYLTSILELLAVNYFCVSSSVAHLREKQLSVIAKPDAVFQTCSRC